jgi:hypothetical protein
VGKLLFVGLLLVVLLFVQTSTTSLATTLYQIVMMEEFTIYDRYWCTVNIPLYSLWLLNVFNFICCARTNDMM